MRAETNGWDLVDLRQGRKTQRFVGPAGSQRVNDTPLLGSWQKPVVVGTDRDAVTGWPLTPESGETAAGRPELIGDGSRMVVRVGRDGEGLRVMETEGEGRILAEAENDVRTPPAEQQLIATDRGETLVADVVDQHRVVVRELPSLRRAAEFSTARPPLDAQGDREPVDLLFLDDRRLITLSGTRLEHWDARTGRRLSKPIDLGDLRLTRQKDPTYYVRDHREPGHVLVSVNGEADVHAVDLRTGRADKGLRMRLGADLNVALFLKDTRYAAVHTVGGMVEVWSVRPGRPERRVVGPVGPLNADKWAMRDLGDAGFLLANDRSVRILRADDPGFLDTYEFADEQGFLTVTKDGRAVLRTALLGGRMELIRLDPAVWKRHLCTVLGRELTEDERGGLAGGLPDRICPP